MNADLRQAQGVVLCVSLGVFFGVVVLVARTLTPFPEMPAVALAGVVGGTVGLVCSAVFVPFLWKKRFRQSTKWLLLVVSPVAVFSGLYWSWSAPWSYSGFGPAVTVPVLTFVTTCCILNRTLRDIHPPGHCQECGYDLTGNVSGVCSECGVEVKSP